MMKRMMMGLVLVAALASPALAGKYDLDFAVGLANSEFKTVVQQAGMLTAYRGVAPAEPGGLTGFDVGVEMSMVKLDSNKWDNAIPGSAPSYFGVPRLHARKGLPFGIDVGASYAQLPASNVKVLGGELQYAILEGSTVTPALAVRGHYSTLQGVDDLDLTSMGADVVASKGFLMLTPYIGAGLVQIDGKYAGSNATLQANLKDQSMTEPRIFGGVQVSIALLRVTLDVEYTEMPVYTAKVSLGW